MRPVSRSAAPPWSGLTYRRVRAPLRAFHPDHAALRRYLVEDDFLSRESGSYWRSGGTVA